MSKTSDFVRENFKKGDDKRDEGLTTPKYVKRFDNILYGKDPYFQSLDVYRPIDNNEILPVIVSIHGGGWVYGDKERYQHYCMSLVQHGFVVVNYSYRLAPEYQYPASIEDTNMVFNWIVENKDIYKMDINNIFGVGDSAGAHLLGIYSNILTNEEYAKKYDLELPDIHFNAIALNCGAYVIEIKEGELTSLLMDDLLPNKGSKEELDLINVPNYVTPNFPPTFLMTCTNDFLKNDAPYMVQAFIKNNVPFKLHYFGDKDTMLNHVFHLNMKMELAHTCNKLECEFFTEYLHSVKEC